MKEDGRDAGGMNDGEGSNSECVVIEEKQVKKK